MASKVIWVASHETQNQTDISLREAFELLEPKLRPPFSSTIPNSQEYSDLNRAILYGILSEPHFAKTHIKHLHAIVTDGYDLFIRLLLGVVNELYLKLVDTGKNQLIWVVQEMVDVLAIGFDGLLIALLRQIVGGDFSDGNLWLCFELVSIFFTKWDCLLEEKPLVLASALYTFLRLLADHYRLSSNAKLEELKQLEIEFCVRVIKDQFHLCLQIGRDFIRILQDLVHVPEFRTIWKDLLLNPSKFKTRGFVDISQFYRTRTSGRYVLLRVTPEMETQLRFLLTHVKLGSQKRHQAWFAKKFLCNPERETLIIDIVRFICCAHHPSNDVIQSDVIPRWAVIGWLLQCCRKHYIEANVKLALFYDWLFFDERAENIMNIEPAMLLMVYSIPRYIDMTHTLLEFLFLLVDNYDVERKDIIARGVSSAFSALVQKGVIHSLDVLVSFDGLSPSLKQRLGMLLSGTQFVSKESQLVGVHLPDRSVSHLHLPIKSCTETFTPSQKGQVETMESLVKNLGEMIKRSYEASIKTLEELLIEFVNLDDNEPTTRSMCPEVLSSRISKEYELNGYKLFAPLELPNNPSRDDEIRSATALVIRTFIFCQKEKMKELLLFWLRNGYPVGARLLSYASRLAYEAYVTGCTGYAMNGDIAAKKTDSGTLLLLSHIDGYISFKNGRKDNSKRIVSTSEMDKNLVAELVKSAFSAYRHFRMYSKDILFKDIDISVTKILSIDLYSCSEWKRKRLKFLFYSIFHHLSDLCVGEVDIIKLLVSQLEHTDLLDIQFVTGLKKISIFGEDTETIIHLIESSLQWGYLEQHNLWGLIRSELTVSKVQVEKIILEFFCSSVLNANIHGIAVGGLLTLCSCHAPTPELVGAIVLLPNNAFQDFAPAVLAAWAVSNESMLFKSLANFSEKLSNKATEEIMINHSAILWLMNYFSAQGMENWDIFSNLSANTLGRKAMEQ